MGHIDVSAVEYTLSDGRLLLNDVSFRVGDGPNGVYESPEPVFDH